MSLLTLHTKHPELLTEHISYIEGQGLIHCYNVRILGTGYNKYTIHMTDGSVLKTEDGLIIEWCVRYQPECPEPCEDTCFKFECYGKGTQARQPMGPDPFIAMPSFANNTGTYAYSLDCDDGSKLEIDGKHYIIASIDVICDADPDMYEKPNISNCRHFCDYRDEIYENIRKYKSVNAATWICDLEWCPEARYLWFRHEIEEDHVYANYEFDFFEEPELEFYGPSDAYKVVAVQYVENWLEKWQDICRHKQDFADQITEFMKLFERPSVQFILDLHD